MEIYTKTNQQKSTQIIFLDQSVPLKYRNTISKNADGTTNTFSAYDEIHATRKSPHFDWQHHQSRYWFEYSR
ncbi:hypothetical protein [Lactococcus sp. dk310]|uniref:hypothetical protein n=1 Tax=Lactococcus sp. dk310 TaxID=2603289 RepID=UPI001650B080|nr:hypothetical protein [Lactococcus sp. dk310]